VYLALTDEQRFLIEAADGALARHDTLAAARAALDGEPCPSLWSLATEAGWTGLLTGEDADGAELTPYDAMLVLESCGRRLADARLLGHLSAVVLVEQGGADDDLRGALARGERRAALVDACVGERSAPLSVRVVANGAILSGAVRAVIDADGADVLVAVGTSDQDRAPVATVIDADAPGVTVTAIGGYDATRALADVVFDNALATALDVAPERVRNGADLQRVLLAAESVGAADACLTMSRDYAVDRMAFGRPIGSYQAIKHKLVEMLRRTEGARSMVVEAGREWDRDRDGFALAANGARVVACEALDYTAPQTIFVHGGVGATWEHDASLYYRRAELSRRLAGGAEAAADAVAEALFAGAGAGAAEAEDRVAVAVAASANGRA
jgi:alkylation response protein AidB-like acyl-CoA dehydrogenase